MFDIVQDLDEVIDYESYPVGWGVDRNARLERVTFDRGTGRWYAAVRHVDEDGEDWYSRYSSAKESADWTDPVSALRWLRQDRLVAPVSEPKGWYETDKRTRQMYVWECETCGYEGHCVDTGPGPTEWCPSCGSGACTLQC